MKTLTKPGTVVAGKSIAEGIFLALVFLSLVAGYYQSGQKSSISSISSIIIPTKTSINQFIAQNHNDLEKLAKEIAKKISQLKPDKQQDAIAGWKYLMEYGDEVSKKLARMVLSNLCYELPSLVIDEPILMELIAEGLKVESNLKVFSKKLEKVVYKKNVELLIEYLAIKSKVQDYLWAKKLLENISKKIGFEEYIAVQHLIPVELLRLDYINLAKTKLDLSDLVLPNRKTLVDIINLLYRYLEAVASKAEEQEIKKLIEKGIKYYTINYQRVTIELWIINIQDRIEKD